MPDKKESGIMIKLVAEAMLSNFSAHKPTTIPMEPKRKRSQKCENKNMVIAEKI